MAAALPGELAAYLAAKHVYEDLVSEWGRTMTPGDPVPAAVKQAGNVLDALKAAGGYAGAEGPACCQRYGFLHEPAYSLPGCRWAGITADELNSRITIPVTAITKEK